MKCWGEMFGKLSLTELSHEQRAEARRQLAETGRRRAEVITYRKDGTQVYAEECSIALRGEQGQITGYLGINRDITERKRSEMALHRSQQELQALTARLIEAQEMESKYLARELHDDFSQKLAVLGMEMAALAHRTAGSSPRNLAADSWRLPSKSVLWRRTFIVFPVSSTPQYWTTSGWQPRSRMNVPPSPSSMAFPPDSIPTTFRGSFPTIFRCACTGLPRNACETLANMPTRPRSGSL